MTQKIFPTQIDQAGAASGQALVWDNTTSSWKPGTVAAGDGGGSAPGSTIDWDTVSATGTGTSQNIQLPESGLDVGDVIVVIEGVTQMATDYTISGDILTLVADVATKIEIRRLTSVYVGVDADDVIERLPVMVAPQLTYLTSGSGTYTTPVGALYLEVEMRGGGSGGAGSGGFASGSETTPAAGDSAAGGDTTFGSLVANGGGPTNKRFGGSGGFATGGDINRVGQKGGDQHDYYTNQVAGMGGGEGGGRAPPDSPGEAATTNSGAGGGGAGSGGEREGGGGGGQGGYCRKIISNPAATYSYSVGAGSAGGTAGANGKPGGSGATGWITIKAYFQ